MAHKTGTYFITHEAYGMPNETPGTMTTDWENMRVTFDSICCDMAELNHPCTLRLFEITNSDTQENVLLRECKVFDGYAFLRDVQSGKSWMI